MSGLNRDFDAAAFRAGITFAFDMAAAPTTADQATFYFPSQLVYNGAVDAADTPFDPAATVTQTPPRSVRVPCGIEYVDADGQLTSGFGVVTASKVKITVLDTDYAQIRGAQYVVIGGDKYLYRRTEPPSGLFDVGLAVLHFAAENET